MPADPTSWPSWVPTFGSKPALAWFDFRSQQYWVSPEVVAESDAVTTDTVPGNANPIPSFGFDFGPIDGLYASGGQPQIIVPRAGVMTDLLNSLISADGGFTIIVKTCCTSDPVSSFISPVSIWGMPGPSNYLQLGINTPGTGAVSISAVWNTNPPELILLPPPTVHDDLHQIAFQWVNSGLMKASIDGMPEVSAPLPVDIASMYAMELMHFYDARPGQGGPGQGGNTGVLQWLAILDNGVPMDVSSPAVFPAFTNPANPQPLNMPLPTPLPCIPCCSTAAPICDCKKG